MSTLCMVSFLSDRFGFRFPTMLDFKQAWFLSFLCCFATLFPSPVRGACECETEVTVSGANETIALKYKVIAIVWVFIASGMGVSFPLLGKAIDALRPERNIFFVIKAFGSGVILSTGFIHVFPDAMRYLTSPCLDDDPWRRFPFAGLVAMLCAIATWMVDVFVTSHYSKPNVNNNNTRQQDRRDAETTGGNEHDRAVQAPASAEVVRYRVLCQLLEFGVLVPSVIIGIILGTSDDPKKIKPLLAALTFHQVFEGVGIGGFISQAVLPAWAVATMSVLFSVTTPVGIAIGIGITDIYDKSDPETLIIQGLFLAAAAGILMYMALVNLLAVDFMNPKVQNDSVLKIIACVSLLIGAGLMSSMALWA